MDRLPSSEFRKTYASLEVQTVVTVNGHAIGLWIPRERLVPSNSSIAASTDSPVNTGTDIVRSGFNTRPFTPVPKRK